jgi:arginase
MERRDISLVGIPMQSGTRVRGCLMGPDALRTAGLGESLAGLGHRVRDLGNVGPGAGADVAGAPAHLHDLSGVVAWTAAIADAAEAAARDTVPVFLGGDHALSGGTVPGVARAVAARGRPLFVLWLDAHADLNTPETTVSGNLHGCPVAYFTGQDGFAGLYPPPPAVVPPQRVGMIGLRSVDPPERAALARLPVSTHDMRALDERGVVACLRDFLDRVEAEDGLIHVSLDVDFLDPGIAPAVGTTVPGGATFREAHLIMEMLCDAGRVAALDLVELNPFLDDRGRTARLLVDLAASLFGRTVLDRPTRSF